MKRNLTVAVIDALKTTGKSYVCWDERERGFGVRVAPGGTKSFIWQGRIGGKEKKAKLSRVSLMKIAEARATAKAYNVKAGAGDDPTIDRAKKLKNPTLKVVAERYFVSRSHKRSLRSEKNTAAKHILPALGTRRVMDISRDDVEALHRNIAEKTPIMANRVIASLRGMLNFAIDRGWLETRNPAAKIEFAYEEQRDNPFTKEEQHRIDNALRTWPDRHFANFFHLLLLTGCRPQELLQSKFEDWDIDGNRHFWNRPAQTVKTMRRIDVPVSEEAAEIVRHLRDQHGDRIEWLFPSNKKKGSHRTTFQKAWRKFRDTLGLKKDHVMYDARHTFASSLASDGGSLGLVGALMGHTKVQTTARYAKYFDEDQRKLVEKMGGLLRGSL